MRTITIENLPLVSPLARTYAAKGHAEGHAEGVVEGRAEAVLAFLDARGIEVPDPLRDRITTCNDLHQLDVWIRRAATVASIDDLFAD
jgi:hypothetical protein